MTEGREDASCDGAKADKLGEEAVIFDGEGDDKLGKTDSSKMMSLVTISFPDGNKAL